MKTIIITGAGSGIGRAAAQSLDRLNDFQLVLLGRTESTLSGTLEMLSGKEHFYLTCDISNAGEVAETFKTIESRCANVVGLFANAGIGGENKFGPNDRWQKIIDVNLTGTYNTVSAALSLFKQAKAEYKHILITSSCLAKFGVPNHTAYITSKTGLLGLTRALAVEHADDHILVNAICPGWVETEMAKEGIQNIAKRNDESYAESFEEQMSYVPLGKMSSPEEIGAFVTYMMTANASMTGQSIDINNGSYMS